MRKTIFWLHLIAGLSAGIVILIMSVTGVLLTYEKQLIAWADREFLEVAPAVGVARVPVATVVAAVHQAEGPLPTSVTLYSQSAAVGVVVNGATHYVNAQNGELLGTGSTGVRSFFRTVTNWHRYIALSGDNRALGKSITGASNLIFLFVVVSGIVIWWRAGVFRFKKGLKGRAMFWNWHHVFGVWALVPLALVVLSATVISYPWASNLVYQFTGTEAPPQGGRRAGSEARGEVAAAADLSVLNSAVDRIQREVPDWKSVTIRIPSGAEPTFNLTVERGSTGQPQYRSTVTVDAANGDISKVETFEDQNRGRRLRTWLRFVHTGEYYGLVGQGVAGVASFAGVVLVGTGFALSFYRALGWVRRRTRLAQSLPPDWAPEKLFDDRDSSYYESQTVRSSEES
jgi:uncharacterized iron-regulated membrane protein